MATYVDGSALTHRQKVGLKWLAEHAEGADVTYADGKAYATAMLAERGDKGADRRDAAKNNRRHELLAAATAQTTKSTIEAQIDAEFTDTE